MRVKSGAFMRIGRLGFYHEEHEAGRSGIAASEPAGGVTERSVACVLAGTLALPVVVLLALLFSPAPARAQVQTNSFPTNFPVPEVVAPNVTRVGILELAAITESSGLARSPNYTNVYWTHNDTGSPHFLFAIDARGGRIGEFEVKGADPIDWEATAFDEAGVLYFADIGTNGLMRSHSAVHRVEEPDPFDRYGPANVQYTWYIRFPGERVDCESFFVHNGFGYLISKVEMNRTANMYRFDLADDSESVLVEFVTTVPVTDDVADAAISRDKSRLAVLTDDGVTVFFINGDPAAVNTVPRRRTEFEYSIMEGIAFADEGLLVTTETTREVLLFSDPLLTGAPELIAGLTDRTAFTGDTVSFVTRIAGVPDPVIEWRFNGVVIPGATNLSLTLTNLTLEQAGRYEILARNPAGEVRASAELTVLPRTVNVRITEVMSSESPANPDLEDWWELTSFDTVTNDLSGWRFNDSTGGLNDAFVIPPGTLIEPGESIVFVEEMTAEEFRAWWGETNVPPAVPIVPYEGPELSFNAVQDSLRLWDDEAVDDEAVFARADFGAAEPGVTFTLDLASEQFVRSQLGVNGAFRAATEPDIGSPGIFGTNSAGGLRVNARLEESGLEISVSSAEASYIVEWTDDLASGIWNESGEIVQGTNAVSVPRANVGSNGRRFYRVRRM